VADPGGAGLGARLDALLADARARGELAELADALGAGAREAALARVASVDTADGVRGTLDVPMRFGMVGASPAMARVFALLERVAPADVPVLIHGETGTGKELVARALHEHGKRKRGPFLAENCAAVPATLLEAELFGHKKGAFTDAHADRQGHFVTADKGTMFLDEIGDMPLLMQAKFLRVLESGEVRPVGSSKIVKVDVRVVAATHRDLAEMVAAKSFRQDLYYRLNVIKIELPPLRERAGDVELLVRFYLARMSAELGITDAVATPAALAALEAAPWPGNVRQLENELRRALALSGGRIEAENLSPGLSG
jgi:transcriptional regulator with GAF, ATPase, and Fis domain